MLRLKQGDKKWGKTLIGDSKSKISTNGCLIVSLCMLISKFYPERGFKNYYSPLEASRDWTYISIPEDTDPKYLVWKSINGSGIKFVWRNYGYQPDRMITDPVTGTKDLEFNILKKYMNHPDYGVTLRVLTLRNNQHWLAGVGKSLLGWAANDPYLGIRLWTAPFPYKRITGWALVARDRNYN